MLGRAGVIALVFLGLAVSSAEAAPSLALVKSAGLHGPERLVTVSERGLVRSVVANGGLPGRSRHDPFSAPSWSPDGRRLAFSRSVGNRRLGVFARLRIFLVGVDGKGLQMIPGTRGGYDPVFSPDGRTIAFARMRVRERKTRIGARTIDYLSVSTWVADLVAGGSRQLTPWRNNVLNTPSSFSPGGETLALSREVIPYRYEAVAMRLDGGGSTVIARNGLDPVYSPDGSRIALARGHWIYRRGARGFAIGALTDLFTVRPDGSDLRRLTVTPRAAERSPDWDPSGQRLAYTRTALFPRGGVLDVGRSVMTVNRDGSCARVVIPARGSAFAGPTWRPGPNRGAARIRC